MLKNPLTYVIVLFLVALAATQCLFVVRQTETALVLQLGEPLPEVRRAGLHAKLPFVQNVVYFDARVLEYSDLRASERQFFTVDQKAIKLDSYARWRIVEPLRFYTAMRGIEQALARIDDVVFSQLHAMVGTYTLTEVVSSHRAAIMKDVCEKVSALMRPFGIEVLDVRIKRMDFPEQNRSAIVERMRSDREREAKKYRSEGEEESTYALRRIARKPSSWPRPAAMPPSSAAAAMPMRRVSMRGPLARPPSSIPINAGWKPFRRLSRKEAASSFPASSPCCGSSVETRARERRRFPGPRTALPRV